MMRDRGLDPGVGQNLTTTDAPLRFLFFQDPSERVERIVYALTRKVEASLVI